VRHNFFLLILTGILVTVMVVPALAGPGVITAVNPAGSSLTVRVLTPGGRQLVGADTVTVLVQTGTEMHFARGDDDVDRGRSGRTGEFRVGDRVHIQAIRLNSGQFLAMRVTVQNRQAPAPVPNVGVRRQTAQGQGIQFQGIVIETGNRSLRVRQTNGSLRTVLVTPTTEITGRVSAYRDVRAGDPVEVRGTLNSDGSVAATRIIVLRPSSLRPGAGATPDEGALGGTIVLKNSTGARFLILSSGLAVSVSDATRIVSGGRLRSFDDLRIGMAITVYGTPITLSGRTLGVNAVLITY